MVPDGLKEKVPAIIMLHGTGTQKDEVGNYYKKLAEKLEHQGIASLRIDFAGFADSRTSELNYSLSSAVKDSSAALTYLKMQSAIDAKRIAVIGFSQSALIAQLFAIKQPEIKAMVLWSPAVGDGTAPMQNFYNSYVKQAKKKDTH